MVHLLEYSPWVVHLTTADRAPSNLCLEASLTAQSPAQEARVWFPCLAHLLSTIARSQYGMLQQPISGCIAYALAQRPAGALEALRHCLELLLLARVVIQQGPRPFQNMQQALLSQLIFASASEALRPQEAKRVQLLSSLLNGHWEEREIIHYCTCKVTCTPESFSNVVAHHLISRASPLFPRHRWTGADATLRSVLQIAVPHRMLEDLVSVWLDCVTKKRHPDVEAFRLRPRASKQAISSNGIVLVYQSMLTSSLEDKKQNKNIWVW